VPELRGIARGAQHGHSAWGKERREVHDHPATGARVSAERGG
jgi:hypothetical protein